MAEIHNGEHPDLKIFVGTPDLDKISRVLLKSAMLICFVWFGYEFVFSENTEMIRKVISGQMRYPTRIPTVWQPVKEESIPPGLSILSKDGERLAFVVTIHLKSSLESFWADILIPNPTETGWEKLAELNKFATCNPPATFECMMLLAIVSRIGYSIAWNMVSWD